MTFLKHAMILLVLVWAFVALYGGHKSDELCVEGRLSAAQARVINSMEWEHCPNYRNGECRAEKNDRVMAGQCSEFMKFLWKPKRWARAIDTGRSPW